MVSVGREGRHKGQFDRQGRGFRVLLDTQVNYVLYTVNAFLLRQKNLKGVVPNYVDCYCRMERSGCLASRQWWTVLAPTPGDAG